MRGVETHSKRAPTANTDEKSRSARPTTALTWLQVPTQFCVLRCSHAACTTHAAHADRGRVDVRARWAREAFRNVVTRHLCCTSWGCDLKRETPRADCNLQRRHAACAVQCAPCWSTTPAADGGAAAAACSCMHRPVHRLGAGVDVRATAALLPDAVGRSSCRTAYRCSVWDCTRH